jgi:hypothetical protein
MAQVVQGKCPHCKNSLRIPAEWVYKSMRCKFCKKAFQAKKPAEAATLAAPRRSDDPFGFDDDGPAIAPSSYGRRRSKKSLIVGLLLFVLALAGSATAGVLLYQKLNPTPPSPGEQVAEGASNAGEQVRKTKPAAKTSGKKPPTVRSGAPGAFPRRALLIGVNNYLMFNSVLYGEPYDKDARFPGSSTSAIRSRLMMPPMNFDKDQIIELSDESKTPQPTQKAVIETTIKDFCDSSRTQDRIIIFFTGHACDIDKDSFLIPIEATRDEPEKLIPLKWVYDQLARCKARQKVLILDVFRYAPARGFELPGAGEGENGARGEVFDQNLQNPPPGVQVWSSCIKEQAAIELDKGSAFVQALLRALQERSVTEGIGKEGDPLPLDDLVVKVNKKLKELLTPEKLEQTSRLTGQEAPGGAAYNPDEPMPPLLAIKPPPAPPGGAASHAQVDKMLEEIRMLPPVRDTRAGEANLLRAANLPAFPAKALDEFKADGYKQVTDLRAEYKKAPEEFAKKYPVRAAVFDTIDALDESKQLTLLESLEGPSPLDQKRKNAFLRDQEKPAELIFKLEGVLGQLKTVAEEEREKETSKRWQANFDYALARLESRLVYLLEYNYLVASIRADRLPDLEPGQSGWRVGTSKKIKINETKAKQLVKDIGKLWKKIEEEYPDTPWAVLARRESLVALGLEWRAKSD